MTQWWPINGKLEIFFVPQTKPMHVDLQKDTNQDQKGNNKYHMVTAAYSTAAPRDTSVPIPTSARIAIETIHSTGIATAPTRPKKKKKSAYQLHNNHLPTMEQPPKLYANQNKPATNTHRPS